ncbi:MAG: alpha/beta fold hydrolase, partial [Myxococcota bacterium]
MSRHTMTTAEGALVYDLEGEGPLVVLICGMGDTRAAWRHVVPARVAGGYRVAALDPRGHGESDATFAAYTPEAVSDDVIALVRSLDAGPAVLVGHSFAGASVVRAAALAPELVAGLVLVAPIVRETLGALGGRVFRGLAKALLQPFWGPWVWGAYYRWLFKAGAPPDHEAHVARVVALQRDPARRRAMIGVGSASKYACGALVDRVTVPVRAVLGALDPDYDAVTEA